MAQSFGKRKSPKFIHASDPKVQEFLRYLGVSVYASGVVITIPASGIVEFTEKCVAVRKEETL
jgi:hypothetical protein